MGDNIVLEESRGTKSKSLVHTPCYQNQIDNVCPEKTELSSVSQRSRSSSIKVSGDLSFDIKKKEQYRLQKHFS